MSKLTVEAGKKRIIRLNTPPPPRIVVPEMEVVEIPATPPPSLPPPLEMAKPVAMDLMQVVPPARESEEAGPEEEHPEVESLRAYFSQLSPDLLYYDERRGQWIELYSFFEKNIARGRYEQLAALLKRTIISLDKTFPKHHKEVITE